MRPAAAGRRVVHVWRHGSFWIISLSFVLLVSSAGAPVPIFAVYQSQYAVTDANLTAAFALYVIAVSGALLVLGRFSDVVGRRPLGVAALCAGAAACLMMSRVDSVSGLYLGRVFQGLAIGTGTSVLGAWTYELRTESPSLTSAVVSGVPTGGLACGALLGGALLDAIDGREGAVMLVIAIALGLSAVLSALVRETTTSPSRRAASARPSLALPVDTRAIFLAAATLGLAAWILGGFYQSLLPSVFARELGVTSHLMGGVGVAALVGTSAITALVVKRRPTTWLLRVGTKLLLAGAVVVAVGLWATSLSLVLLGTVVTGTGHGSMFLVAVRVVAERCDAAARAGVLAAFYLACYVGSVLPMLLAGWAAEAWGLSVAMTVIMMGAAVLAGTAGLWIARTIRRAEGPIKSNRLVGTLTPSESQRGAPVRRRQVTVGIGLTNHGDTLEHVDPRDIARAVESAGFDSLWVTDHIVLPQPIESRYPFSQDGRFFLPENGLWFEALTTLTYAAAATKRLRLGVGVMVVGLRDPRLLSQQLAALDQLTGGRVVLAAGAGWMLEEFAALELPTTRRGDRLDGAIDLVRACWTGSPPGGSYGPFTLPDNVATRPTPAQPRIPILFAGEGPKSLERIVARGDGWYGASGIGQLLPVDVVHGVRAGLEERCEAHGRPVEDMTLALRLAIPRRRLGEAEIRETLEAYVAAGVTDFTIDFSFRSLDSARDALAELAANVAHLRTGSSAENEPVRTK